MKFHTGMIALAALCVASTGTAKAAFIVDIAQVGANVVADGGGTMDTTDLTAIGTFSSGGASIESADDSLFIEQESSTGETMWQGLTGPASFGTGNTTTTASSSTAGPFIFEKYFGTLAILIPSNYISGDGMASSDTFDNTTLADLGLTPGASYTWTWGTGPDADYFEINVENPLPEPASLAVLAGGIGALGFIRRRRRQAAT
jgi:hypothetical protein